MWHARKATWRWSAPCSPGGPRSTCSPPGATPLYVACIRGHTEVVRALLSWGAKVDLQTTEGETPLHEACINGHTEVVGALLSAEAKINLVTKGRFSPLHVACQEGHTEGVHALL